MIKSVELPAAQDVLSKTPDKYKFKQVKDSRGRIVEGVWLRNERYYGQLQIPGKGCRRVTLDGENRVPVTCLKDAQASYRRLLTNRAEGDLPQSRRSPIFSEYHAHYTNWIEKMGKKSKLTIDKEKFALRGWAETLGDCTLTQITRAEVNRHLMARKESGRSNRTLNLDLIALGNCLKFAKQEEHIKQVITDDIEALDHKAPTRNLIEESDLDKLCAEATRLDDEGNLIYANGQQLSDYIKFMTFSGARRESALFVKWEDIDFDNRRLTLVKNKYSKANLVVTFNDRLEKLLIEMKVRRLDLGSPWLFPNPFQNQSRANFRKTFDKVRTATKLENFTFHDCRHFFISWAVMANIPYLTIAKWVGHTDGGVLIGSTYGHLNDAHLQEAALKLTFGKRQDPLTTLSIPSQDPAKLDLTKMSATDLLAALAKLQIQQAQAA